MQPAVHNFDPITRGDSETLAIGLVDHDEATGQDTIPNLAGAQVEWRLRAAGEADIVLTVASNELSLDAATGWITWEISASRSATLKAISYNYRIRLTFANGEVRTYLAGTLPVRD